MKHILLLATTFLLFASAIAQPTLTAATNNPVAGDVITGFICDTSGYSGVIAGGASGAGVTWNFGSLRANTYDTSIFTSGAGSLYIDSFPGSNLLGIDRYSVGVTRYGYYETTNDYCRELGLYDSLTHHCYYFVNARPFIYYPLSYGATITVDTTIQDDSITHYHVTSIDSTIVDAYGTLTTPAGTYSNVLRVHTIVHQKDSSLLFGTYFYRSEGYSWFQPGFHNTLLSLGYDTSGELSI